MSTETTETTESTTAITQQGGSTMAFEKTEFKCLDEGEYLVRMSRITEVVSKAGNPMLKISYQVVKKVGDTSENESKAKNRLIFENFLTEHKNPKVAEITRDRLDKYLKAVGVDDGLSGVDDDFSRLEDYLELPFIAVVGIQAGSNGYKDSNKIKAFKRR
jgi:hypothetical protein